MIGKITGRKKDDYKLDLELDGCELELFSGSIILPGQVTLKPWD